MNVAGLLYSEFPGCKNLFVDSNRAFSTQVISGRFRLCLGGCRAGTTWYVSSIVKENATPEGGHPVCHSGNRNHKDLPTALKMLRKLADQQLDYLSKDLASLRSETKPVWGKSLLRGFGWGSAEDCEAIRRQRQFFEERVVLETSVAERLLRPFTIEFKQKPKRPVRDTSFDPSTD